MQPFVFDDFGTEWYLAIGIFGIKQCRGFCTLYNVQCTLYITQSKIIQLDQSWTMKEGFVNGSLPKLGKGVLTSCNSHDRFYVGWVLVHELLKFTKPGNPWLCQSWPALPSCHVECPLSTIWHFEPQFGGTTRILMQKCQAPSNGPFRIKSKFALPLFHSNYVSMGRKGERVDALRN